MRTGRQAGRHSVISNGINSGPSQPSNQVSGFFLIFKLLLQDSGGGSGGSKFELAVKDDLLKARRRRHCSLLDDLLYSLSRLKQKKDKTGLISGKLLLDDLTSNGFLQKGDKRSNFSVCRHRQYNEISFLPPSHVVCLPQATIKV
jgi:hypothetical protein